MTSLLTLFGIFFAIMNPFVNLPVFLTLTDDFSVEQRKNLAIKVVLFSTIMCIVILMAGQRIISFFGIEVDDFRVAGGLVLAHIAWSMLNGNEAASHHGSEQEKGNPSNPSSLSTLAFFPLTFPMIVGPGSIATMIIYAGQAKSMTDFALLSAILALILTMLFLVFYFASQFSALLTETMRMIMTRLMGMILLAISVAMVVSGIKVLLPGLA
ncbi:MarC family protein [uncultured Cohaesibacter sp.]|uniref:MarC family protein n=1 Tax=uncultured Cohaesibacter sp. TaxID=1002546 RepID=UPI0029315E65|nr:MarC family protein [uncultured Cohaesibacter sp.]